MTETTPSRPTGEVPHHQEVEDFAGGTIQSRHGYLPIWLLVVYLILAVWGLYYAFYYWGGVGPGRIL